MKGPLITSSAELTPFPGLSYAPEETNYIVPDVYVRKFDGEYEIRLNDDDLPQLKLSSLYQDLLKNDTSLEKESRQYISEKLKNADWFIKSLYPAAADHRQGDGVHPAFPDGFL